MPFQFAPVLRACCVAGALTICGVYAAETKAPLVGATRAQILARLGEPKSQIVAGNREVLFFPGERIVLRDNVVIEADEIAVDVAPPEPAPAAASANATADSNPTSPPTSADTGPNSPASDGKATIPTNSSVTADKATSGASSTSPVPSRPAASSEAHIISIRPPAKTLAPAPAPAPVPPPTVSPAPLVTSTPPPTAGVTNAGSPVASVPAAPATLPAPTPSTAAAAPSPAASTVVSTPPVPPIPVATPEPSPATSTAIVSSDVTSTSAQVTPETTSTNSSAVVPPPSVGADATAPAPVVAAPPVSAAAAARHPKVSRPGGIDEPDVATSIFTPQTYLIAFVLIAGGAGYLFWRVRERRLALVATAFSRSPFAADVPVTNSGARFTAELLNKLEWKRFEELVASYYNKTGVVASRSKTGPASPVHIKISWKGEPRPFAFVQCIAHPAGLIEPPSIQGLCEALAAENIRRGYVVTSGKFGVPARDLAEEKHITLLTGDIFLEKLNALPDAARQELMREASSGDYQTPTCPQCEIKMARAPSDSSMWQCVQCGSVLPRV